MINRIKCERTNEASTHATKAASEKNVFNRWDVRYRFRNTNGIREHGDIATG